MSRSRKETGAEGMPAQPYRGAHQALWRIQARRPHDRGGDSDKRGPPPRDQTRSLFVSKVFDNQNFSYLKITVERPLRLNFAVTDERIHHFKRTNAFVELAISRKRKNKAKLIEEELKGADAQAAILEVLDGMKGASAAGQLVTDRAIFAEQLSDAFEEADITLASNSASCPLTRSARSSFERDLDSCSSRGTFVIHNISDRHPCGNHAKPLIEGVELAQKRLEGRLAYPSLLWTRRILERLQAVQNQ
jgi:hypothetical protein